MTRFWTIIFPLLSPTAFFLLVVNVVYAFFDTFAIVDATTQGGPAGATQILVYKLWQDGFQGLDLGGSAAQSVVLMVDRHCADSGPVPLDRAQGAVLNPMIERRPFLDAFRHVAADRRHRAGDAAGLHRVSWRRRSHSTR